MMKRCIEIVIRVAMDIFVIIYSIFLRKTPLHKAVGNCCTVPYSNTTALNYKIDKFID